MPSKHLPKAFNFTSPTTDKGWINVNLPEGVLKNTYIDHSYDSGAEKNSLASSIPNPLARIHLYTNAFKYFTLKIPNNPNYFDATTYNGFVSDCFDLLQFYFEQPNQIEFANFSYTDHINTLGIEFNFFKKGLKFYLEKDKLADYNFKLIYVKTETGKILVGATSKETLIYISPNWKIELEREKSRNPTYKLSTRGKGLDGDDIMDEFFDAEIRALENRDSRFILFIYSIFFNLENGNLIQKHQNPPYKVLFDFLNQLLTLNNGAFKEKIIVNWNALSVDNWIVRKNMMFEGVSLKERPISENESVSPCCIAPTKTVSINFDNYGNKKPLIFPPNAEHKANCFKGLPYPNSLVLNASSPFNIRRVSFSNNETYPWLCADDFFVPVLFQLKFKANTDRFYGVLEEFMCPVKPVFFEFFNQSDLDNNISTKVELDGSVKFSLKVPIEGNRNDGSEFCTLEKIYKKGESIEVLEDFNFAMSPFRRYSRENDFETNILVYEPSSLGSNINFYLLQENGSLVKTNNENNGVYKNKRELEAGIQATHYSVSKKFSVLELCFKNNKTVWLYPKFEIVKVNNDKQSFFAIDFGTSNTFVAYSIAGTDDIAPLTFKDTHVAMLSKKGNESNPNDVFNVGGLVYWREAFETQFFPYQIRNAGAENTYSEKEIPSFPIRTVAVYGGDSEGAIFNDLKSGNNPNLFTHSNVSFSFESDYQNKPQFYNYITNLKPKFESESRGIGTALSYLYLKQILLLIKEKLKEEGLDYTNTKIYWSYPATGQFKGKLETLYNEISAKIFETNNNNIFFSVTESEAPIFFGLDQASQFEINIDIGGGTTDYSIKASNIFIDSVKFAGNDLWGGKDNEATNNFFYTSWNKKLGLKVVRTNPNYILPKILMKYESNKTPSTDYIQVLFKYENESGFSAYLSNEGQPLKLAILLHFNAILFYFCHLLLKNKDLGKELQNLQKIRFTGKGSAYLKILFPKEQQLSSFVKSYVNTFNKRVANDSLIIDANFLAYTVNNPKEVTAFGAIKKGQFVSENDITVNTNREYRKISLLSEQSSSKPSDWNEMTPKEKEEWIANNIEHKESSNDEKLNAVFSLIQDSFNFLEYVRGVQAVFEDSSLFEALTKKHFPLVSQKLDTIKNAYIAIGVDNIKVDENLYFKIQRELLNTIGDEIATSLGA